MALILILVAFTLSKFGFAVDPAQISLTGVGAENIRMGLVMAIYGFVAFESSASLGVEAVNPLKTIPRAIMLSVIITGIFFIASAYAMVLSFHATKTPLATCSTPLLVMAENIGMPFLGQLIDAGIMVSIFAAALANMNASSRMIYKMSQDGIFHQALGKAHKNNGTPHIAIFTACGLSLFLAFFLVILRCPLMDIVGWLGTLATFGFIYGYIATSLAAGKMLRKENKLTVGKMLLVGGSLAILCLSLFGSLYPAPAFPYNILPFIFAAYMATGSFFCLRD